MKAIGLILIGLLPLSFAFEQMEGVCSIAFDRHDRAAMYSRNFIVGSSTKWPHGQVPYKISDDFTESEKEEIKKAMATIEAGTCIRFLPHTLQENYVGIITGSRGCYANLGFNPFRKVLTLHLQRQSFCMRQGTIVHELLHVLGYAHEHTRPDRDQYLKINWQKLPVSHVSNWFRAGGLNESPLPPVCDSRDPTKDFDKCYAGFKADTFGVEYDYGSVMHYGLRAGTSDGSKAMEALKEIPVGTFVGQRTGMSKLDFKKVNAAYNCNPTTTTTSTTTTEKTTTTEETTTTEKTTTLEKTTTARRTTSVTPPCADSTPACSWLSKYCDVAWIKRDCKKSCDNCAAHCKDKYSNCHELGYWCKYYLVVKYGCPSVCGC